MAKPWKSTAAHWTPYIIEYKGTFDLEGLYKMIVEWLQDRSFEFHEKAFKHKPGGGGGNEQEWFLESFKKTTHYYRYWMNLHFKIWDMQEVEIEHDGEIKTMINGRLRILMTPKIDKDWQGKWQTSDTMKRVQFFYDKFIAWKDLSSIYGDLIHYQFMKLHNEIKEFLGMEAPSRAFYHYMGGEQSG